MNKCALLLFSLFLFSTNIYSQKIGERLTMNIFMGPQISDNYGSSMSLNLGLETKVKLADFFHIGIRYENGIIDFGYELFQGSTNTNYLTEESPLKRARKIGVVPIIDLSEIRNSIFFGFGFFYAYYPGRITNGHWESGEIIESSTTSPEGFINRVFIIGAEQNRWNFGMSYLVEQSRFSSEQVQLWMGYEIVSAYKNKRIKYNKRSRLKKFYMEVGLRWNVPLNPKKAASTSTYIAPKIALNDDYTIGIEWEEGGTEYGDDKDFDIYYFEHNSNLFQRFRKHNILSRTSTISVILDKYKRGTNGWLFYGGGLGLMNIEGLSERSGFDAFQNEIILDEVEDKRTVVFNGRFGVKAGGLRPSIAVNAALGDVPVHVSFRMGVELGLLKRKAAAASEN